MKQSKKQKSKKSNFLKKREGSKGGTTSPRWLKKMFKKEPDFERPSEGKQQTKDIGKEKRKKQRRKKRKRGHPRRLKQLIACGQFYSGKNTEPWTQKVALRPSGVFLFQQIRNTCVHKCVKKYVSRFLNLSLTFLVHKKDTVEEEARKARFECMVKKEMMLKSRRSRIVSWLFLLRAGKSPTTTTFLLPSTIAMQSVCDAADDRWRW